MSDLRELARNLRPYIEEAGLYYTQDGVTYLCTRDTGIAVYNDLSDLVGIYVEEAS